jgi:hypothetical protein
MTLARSLRSLRVGGQKEKEFPEGGRLGWRGVAFARASGIG